jgi:hypothetical protein
VDDTLALLPPDALWPPLPPPDLSQPPPWLLPPPAPGAPPPPPPPGGWASSWEARALLSAAVRVPGSRLTRPARASRPAQTAVEWPPPPAPPWAQQDVPQTYAHAAFWPPPGGHAAATYDDDDANDDDEYEDDAPYDEPYDEGAFAATGEVVWRVGDALDDEEEDETPEVALELTDEWAARFALTEHRRAQRTPQPSLSFGFCASFNPHNSLTRRAGRPALRRQAAGASCEPTRRAGARRAAERRHACRRPGGAAAHGRGHRARCRHRHVAAQRRCVASAVFCRGLRCRVDAPMSCADPHLHAPATACAALYGAAGAVRVAALEAAVQARYTKAQSGGKALLWPCEPLRSA